MTQVKFFDSSSSIVTLERKINDFLSEQADNIEVKMLSTPQNQKKDTLAET